MRAPGESAAAAALGSEPASSRESAFAQPYRRSHAHGLLPALQSLLNLLVVALFVLTFIVQPFRIPSGSMEPTLLVGDFLLVEKQVGPETWPRIFAPLGEVHRGDIVIFHFPVDTSMHLVKRVIGVPGDRIRLQNGRVYINGNPLDEPYALYGPAPEDSYRDDFPRMDRADAGVDAHWWVELRSRMKDGELTVPEGSYFVLGDNRNDSDDSRYWGFVPHANIVGKPLMVYFSLNDGENHAPGQQAASAMPGGGGSARDDNSHSRWAFARWNRVLRVVR